MTAHRPLRNGFTLIEVLVALAIVAVTLIAGLQATAAMTRNTERQTLRVLAQLCAENTLAQLRLARLLPDVSDTVSTCRQAGRALDVRLLVQPTPNPNFRRIDVRVGVPTQGAPGPSLLQLSTVMGRY